MHRELWKAATDREANPLRIVSEVGFAGPVSDSPILLDGHLLLYVRTLPLE
ncbi:hypothetical protein AZE42_07059 [Rhizopogon vesiculosus]|uniref:Uncharacterized protein n=1 Tax=Rhizopogon vesiculosus TaxID=180088 RepID=A0A1J8PVU2_9AGAM|nr:hypothetical protein AZE42_07059 [Rhizopogon vesiculosus]